MDKQGIEKLGALLGGCTKQLLICELAFLKGLSFEFQRDVGLCGSSTRNYVRNKQR